MGRRLGSMGTNGRTGAVLEQAHRSYCIETKPKKEAHGRDNSLRRTVLNQHFKDVTM